MTLLTGRTWRGLAVVAAVVAGSLIATAAPAQAAHFAIQTRSYLAPTPWDAGGRDATIEVYRVADRDDHAYGVFRAAGETVTVTNTSGGWARWQLVVPGIADPSGYLDTGTCVMWGASRSTADAAGCQYWGNQNIAEGTYVQLIVCVQTYHGWVCPAYDQRARGRA